MPAIAAPKLTVGSEVYPEPALFTVTLVTLLFSITAVAVALEPPPPEIVTLGALV